ncbi:hypothetical protein D9619_004390 [Psilocybe cf. subviscida]|uniref:Uncharacterized protein n=1 Tax=Psilocybe cf. subviscida TaxID=2480587 RepID=A0A8H5BPJ1_9AGAR|nr:hypothetical protein D9619_004390 [Psilocybe cf. subviscida]
MPKDKSPASSAASGEEDGGASPASTSTNDHSLFEKPKLKRFIPVSFSSSKSRLTAERREEIRQQARQKMQERKQRREALAADATRPTLPPIMAGPSSQRPRSNDGSPNSSSDGGLAYSGTHAVAPPSSGSSFFSSAINIGIGGGHFSLDSSSYRNSTNLTINLHHGLPADNTSVYGEPFDPITGVNPASLQGSSQYSQYYSHSRFPFYHTPNPYEPPSATSRSFPSTRHIRDVFNSTDEVNNFQSTGGGSFSFANPEWAGRDSQNIAAPPLTQSSSSSSSASSSGHMVVAQEDRSVAQAQNQSESSELQAQKSSDIYCRHLSVKQRGFPLWIPEPNCYLPIQYQRKGISIGDVGIITAAGSFDYLFNVLLTPDHPFNMGRVPPGFVPLLPLLDPSDIRGQLEFRSNSYIASSSVKRTLGNSDDLGTTFHISASEGAILTIPDGALSEDLGNLVRLRRYMSENVESWYRHANGPRGRELANGDLRLVIGCDKTAAWGMAAFANLSQGEDTRLRFKLVGATYGWELHSGTAEVRSGPDPREIRALSAGDTERGGEPRAYENQCIFVRTLNATLHDTLWLELMAEISVPGDSGGSASSNDVDMSSATSGSPGARPISRGGRFLANDVSTDFQVGNSSQSANGSNDRGPFTLTHASDLPSFKVTQCSYLQQYMDAKMAITDDSDWSSVLTENDIVMPKPKHLTERIMANSTPIRDDAGVLYLQKNNATSLPPLVPPLAELALSMPPLRLPTPPPLNDFDDMSFDMPPPRRSARMIPMRHQSGSPSSM